MVETQFPKFRWDTISEQNSGHTKDEWGSKQAPKKVITYTVIWDKKNLKNYFTTSTGRPDLCKT